MCSSSTGTHALPAVFRPSSARRVDCVEGQLEAGDAPVFRILLRRPVTAVRRPYRRVHHFQADVARLYGVVALGAGDRVLEPAVPGVQVAEMDRVDVAFHRLDEVALTHRLVDPAFFVEVRQQVGQRRRHGARSHVSPDDAVALNAWVGNRTHLVLEIAFRRLRRHIDAGAGDVELPAVVNAAQSFLFVAPEKHRGASMRATVLNNANGSRAYPEADEVFAKQTQRGPAGSPATAVRSASAPVSSTGAESCPSASLAPPGTCRRFLVDSAW